MPETSDEELMSRLQQGEAGALDVLYQRYSRKLGVFCAAALSSREPEDLVHDVFLRVIEAAGQFDTSRGGFRAWLFKIARHRAVDVARRARRSRAASLDQISDPVPGLDPAPLARQIASGDPGAGECAIAVEEAEAVRDCLTALAVAEEREALVLYYVGGLLFREIGQVLGKSTSMAQKWIASGKEKMKRCLERKGVAP